MSSVPVVEPLVLRSAYRRELPIPLADQTADPAASVLQIHHQVLDGLDDNGWVKRDSGTGRFLDRKADDQPFKGVRREN